MAGLLGFGLLLLASSVFTATPAHPKAYSGYYKGAMVSCASCHTKAPKLSAYGTELHVALKGKKTITPTIFKTCETKRPK